ncbi:MAG: ATPase [Clostridiales bacterium]
MDRVEMDGIENILGEMEESIAGASRIPLTGKVLIDGDLVLEYVDKIYAVLPEELKQARQVLDQSDKLLESMESQGKRILDDARRQSASLVQESEIVKEAQLQAEQLRLSAEKDANDFQQEAVNYADDLLQQLEMNLEKAIFTIRKSREDLKTYR